MTCHKIITEHDGCKNWMQDSCLSCISAATPYEKGSIHDLISMENWFRVTILHILEKWDTMAWKNIEKRRIYLDKWTDWFVTFYR